MKIDERGNDAKLTVLPPITRPPEDPRDTLVPDMVTGGPPGTIEVSAKTKPAGLAVNVWPPTVKIDDGGRAMMLLPTTRPADPSEIGVPDMVIGGAPGIRVVLSTTNPFPDGAGVIICPATVAIGVATGAGKGTVLLPTTSPREPNETGVPDMVIAALPGATVIPPIITAELATEAG